MRTTLSIDDDVIAAAKALARQQHKSIGQIISELARQALRPQPVRAAERNGVPLLPGRAGVAPVTPELVDQLLDELS